MQRNASASCGCTVEVNVEVRDKYPISSKTFWVAIVCIGLGVYLVVEGYREEGLQLIGLLGIRDAIRKVEKV